jgi:hypothetical protein
MTDIAQRHRHAGAREGARHAESDPRSGSRDDRGPAFQSLHRSSGRMPDRRFAASWTVVALWSTVRPPKRTSAVERGEGMFRVRSPQDLGAGVVFVLIGVAGLVFGRDLATGSAARMGPGYFPMLLSGLIIAIGLVLAVRSLATDGPAIPAIHLRPLLAILAAILAFGLLIDRIGLALTAAVLTVMAAYARRDVNPGETLLLAAGLALFTVGVFVYALTQPLPAWWGR